MRETTWAKNKIELLEWVKTQPDSDNIKAILLTIEYGDNAENDDLRRTYWTAICSIGGYRHTVRDGNLRGGFETKLSHLSCKIKGRVIYRNGSPSLEDLKITGTLCDNEKGRQQEIEIRDICSKYNIQKQNITIDFVDCSPKSPGHPSSKWMRSVSNHGIGNRNF